VLSPAPIAHAVNANGAFLAALMQNMSTAGTAQAINANPGFLKALLSYIDINKINNMMSSTWSWTAKMVGKLDPGVIAGIVNANGTFLTRLVSKLDPDALAQGMNADPAFVIALVGKLSPQVVANVVNNNGTFLKQFMGKMNVQTTAQAINNNVPFVRDLVSFLNPHVIAGVVNDMDPTITQKMLLPPPNGIDPAVIATIVNTNGQFLDSLLANLNPTVLANALNTDGGQSFLTAMLNPTIGLDPAVLAQASNANMGFTAALLAQPPDGINPAILANAINSNGPFITGLLANLNADVINNAMKANTLRTYDPGGPKGTFYDLVRPYNPADPHATTNGLNPAVVAGIVNNNPSFLGALMGGMDPVATSDALESANGRAFINHVITDLGANTTALKNVADALVYVGPQGNAIEMSRQLMIALGDNATVQFLANQLNMAGSSSALQMVTMKCWSNNSMLSDPYMYGTFLDASVAGYPL
jgi:hypothetical protein